MLKIPCIEYNMILRNCGGFFGCLLTLILIMLFLPTYTESNTLHADGGECCPAISCLILKKLNCNCIWDVAV